MTEYITQEQAQKLWTQTCGNAHDLCNAAIAAYIGKGEPVAWMHPTLPKAASIADLENQQEHIQRDWFRGARLYTHPPGPNARLVETLEFFQYAMTHGDKHDFNKAVSMCFEALAELKEQGND